MMKKTATLIATAMLPALAFAWGQKGHDTTAAIAERHLSDPAREAISELLDGQSIVYWSNWLDNASHTPEYAYTKTWHYKNIDAGTDYDEAPILETGNVVTALTSLIPMLSDTTLSKEKRAEALKMVVHLVGDLHQPMHMGHASDLGGNRVTVKYFGRNNNLHSIWDSSVLESGHKWSYTEWMEQTDRVNDAQIAEIQQGWLDDWGKECYSIATEIYDKTPDGTQVSYDYIALWTPTIEQQLLKGGLRLARVLNEAFR